jgi:hypothetical protein
VRPDRIRTRDPLLRSSFFGHWRPAAFLVRVGLLVVWLHFNAPGFRCVLARGWHGYAWLPVTLYLQNTPSASALSLTWGVCGNGGSARIGSCRLGLPPF